MEQLNSGDSLYIWSTTSESWVPLEEAYLEEANIYKWRYLSVEIVRLTMQNVPLLSTRVNEGWEGVFETPFQSGIIQFEIRKNGESKIIENYVYPDKRKITLNQYNLLLKEILEEVTICFQNSGLETNVKADGFSRNLSMLQWNYIEQQIEQLRTIFRKIQSQPLRVLNRKEEILKRERIKMVTPNTLSWMERYGESYGGNPSKLPSHLKSTKVEETYNVYENRVILAQLNELQKLIQKYSESNQQSIKQKSLKYIDWISQMKKADFLSNIKPHIGTIKVSQVFRKSPLYRLWFQWFQELYDFKEIKLELEQRLPLKDTYQLYELWCFMQIIKCLREANLLGNAEEIFTFKDNQYYLHLSENKESVITLTNGAKLSYQKVIQNNTDPFYSYTQRMIPDIVIEKDGYLYILDPKYRVPQNLSTALGEMHKYRDGILRKGTEEKVVKEVYILTPQRANMSEEKDFYSDRFQQHYKMGAFCLRPGDNPDQFKRWLLHLLI